MNGQKDALQYKKEKVFFSKGHENRFRYKPGIEIKRNKRKKGPAQNDIERAARQKFPEESCKSEKKNCHMDLQGPFVEYGLFQGIFCYLVSCLYLMRVG